MPELESFKLHPYFSGPPYSVPLRAFFLVRVADELRRRICFSEVLPVFFATAAGSWESEREVGLCMSLPVGIFVSICFYSFGCLIQKMGPTLDSCLSLLSWLIVLTAKLNCFFDHILVVPFRSAGKLLPFVLNKRNP